MKVFVSGVNGQLGRDVVKKLISRGHIAIGKAVVVLFTQEQMIRSSLLQESMVS